MAEAKEKADRKVADAKAAKEKIAADNHEAHLAKLRAQLIIDPKTGNIIEVFHSNREVIKKFQISSITLRKISDTDIIHNGYKWRVIENA